MTINEIQDKIIEDFSRFDDWFDTYEELIRHAKELEQMDDALKNDEHSIAGCQSQLWLCGKLQEGGMKYWADSDTMITKGIVALIVKALENQSPTDIVEADLYFIDKIGLGSNLSPARSNGITAMVKKAKDDARKALAQ